MFWQNYALVQKLSSGKLQKSMFSKFEDFTSIIVSSEKNPSKAYLKTIFKWP